MDAEKFDKVVLDLLYDELDELTRASAIRHMEQSGKAKALYAELRATREVGALPLVTPPSDLTSKILAAEERARAGRPLHQRMGGVVSRIASYTMRPQVGMAAVLMLMLGSGLLFLRVKPGEPNSVQVTERGVPESDKESVALVPVPEAPPAPVARAQEGTATPRASRARSEGYRGDGMDDARKGAAPKSAAEPRREDDLAAAAPPPPPLQPAPASADEAFGGAAVGRASGPYDQPAKEEEAKKKQGPCSDIEEELARAASPIEANRARWSLAECFSSVGQNEQARRSYKALLSAPAYAERARRALATLSEPSTSPPAAAAPAKPSAPAATTNGEK